MSVSALCYHIYVWCLTKAMVVLLDGCSHSDLLKEALNFKFFLAFVKLKCSSLQWQQLHPHAFEANNPDWWISSVLAGWYWNSLIVQLHWNCGFPPSPIHLSASRQASTDLCGILSASTDQMMDLETFWMYYWEYLLPWVFHGLTEGIKVITKIIIDHKLISKVVFTATGFPVLEDHLWLFPFPVSSPILSLLSPWRCYSCAKLRSGWWPILMGTLIF